MTLQVTLTATLAALLCADPLVVAETIQSPAPESRVSDSLHSALQARDLDRVTSWVEAERLAGRGTKAADQLTLALKAKDPVIRWQAARVLPRLEADAVESLPSLLEATKDRDALVRWSAAEALRDLAPLAGPKAVDLLVEAIRDGDPLVRWAAVEAIAVIGPDARKAEPVLRRLVRYDEHEIVRREALLALQAVAPDRFPTLGLRDRGRSPLVDVR